MRTRTPLFSLPVTQLRLPEKLEGYVDLASALSSLEFRAIIVAKGYVTLVLSSLSIIDPSASSGQHPILMLLESHEGYTKLFQPTSDPQHPK